MSSDPSPHVGELTNAYNSSIRGSDPLFGLQELPTNVACPLPIFKNENKTDLKNNFHIDRDIKLFWMNEIQTV